MLQRINTYIMTEANDYRVVIGIGPQESEHLPHWEEFTSEDFNKAIGSLGGFTYRKESYEIGARKFVEHIWERTQEEHA